MSARKGKNIKGQSFITLAPRQISSFIKTTVEKNRAAQFDTNLNNGLGWLPIAIEIEGNAGIGKSSLIDEIAKELKIDFVKVNLGELSDEGDLLGLPSKKFEICNPEGQCRFVPESTVSVFVTQGWELTGKFRTENVAPEWLERILSSHSGGILLLDDATRASSNMMQAIMELIREQKYHDWRLPKGWTIILTTNPAEGTDEETYFITARDKAQTSRVIKVNMEFSHDDWVDWMFRYGIDSQFIAFALKYKEVFSPERFRGNINPRSLVTTFQMLRGVTSFRNEPILFNVLNNYDAEFARLLNIFLSQEYSNIETVDDLMKDLTAGIEKIKSYRENQMPLVAILAYRMIDYAYEKKFANAENWATLLDAFPLDLQRMVWQELIKGSRSVIQKDSSGRSSIVGAKVIEGCKVDFAWIQSRALKAQTAREK